VCAAAALPEYLKEYMDWADSFDEYMGPTCAEDSKLWHRCVPFAPVGNGDHLGLDIGASDQAPPVAYLCHDGEGESRIIAPTFDNFLQTWEDLYYVGPAIWILHQFIDPVTGFLCSQSAGARELRQMFENAFRTGEFRCER